MAIIRWNPLRELQTMQERMNRLFDENFFRWGRPADLLGGVTEEWPASVNMYDTENDLVMKVEMPGVKKEDLYLEVKDNTVLLKAERKAEQEETSENYFLREFRYGSFQRSFALPGNVDADKIKAEYKDGILKITMSKAESYKAKKITIQA